VPDPSDGYTVIGGLLSCGRCGALLLDKPAERDLHDAHHRALRALWGQQAGPGVNAPGGGRPRPRQR
jgi:hypothetical protein